MNTHLEKREAYKIVAELQQKVIMHEKRISRERKNKDEHSEIVIADCNSKIKAYQKSIELIIKAFKLEFEQ